MLCLHVGSSSKAAGTHTGRAAERGHEPVVGHVDLLAGRPDVGRLLVAVPRPALLADRGRHRVDPLLPAAGRAHPGPPLGLDAAPLPDGSGPAEVFRERVLCCFINDPVGISLLDQFNLDNVCWESDYPALGQLVAQRARGQRGPVRAVDRGRGRQDHPQNAMRHFSFDPVRHPAAGALHRGRAAEPRRTDVDTVTRVGRAPDESDRDYFRNLSGAARPSAGS